MGKKRKAAVFTIQQNERHFLPLWTRYYRRHFDDQDIYILNHGTKPAFWQEAMNNIVVHNDESFDHDWLRETVQTFQAFLLNSYECVVFAEVDEFLVCDNSIHHGLDEAVDRLLASSAPAMRCTGVEVVDRIEAKPSYERATWYDKTLISRVPLRWTNGFHTADALAPLMPGLYLIHTHRADYQVAREKHRETAKRKWSQKDANVGLGWHNRIEDDAAFDKWFFRHDGDVVDLPENILKQLQ